MPHKITTAKFAAILIAIAAFGTYSSAQGPPPKFFDERLVIKAMAHLIGAQATYQSTAGSGSYGSLTQLRAAGLVDEATASGRKYGYYFFVTAGPKMFTARATPVSYRKTGLRSYYTDQRGVLFGADKNGLPADDSDAYIDACSLWGIADNDRCTREAMRTLHGAEMTYAATVGNNEFGSIPELYVAGLIDMILGTSSKHGYNFEVQIVSGQPATFKLRSRPAQYGVTGIRSFYLDQTGVLRGADRQGGHADQNDPPVND